MGTVLKSRWRGALLRRAVSSPNDFAPGGSREGSATLATPSCSAAKPVAPATIPSPIVMRAKRRPGAVFMTLTLAGHFGRRLCPCWRRHKLRADRIDDRFPQDSIDLRLGATVQEPAADRVDRLHLIGTPSSPEGHRDPLVQHPAHGEVDHPLVITSGELIQPSHGVQILAEARLLELRIGAAQIVALEGGLTAHAARQESATQGAIAQGCNAVKTAIRQYVRLDATLEEIIGRLHAMQRGDLAKSLDLLHRKITDADGADLAPLQKIVHRLGGLLNRHRRVRPMHLIEIDDVRLEPAQGFFDFAHDPRTAGVAEHLSVPPLEPDLACEMDTRAQIALRDGPSDDFLRMTEAVGGRGIDEVDPIVDCRANRGDRPGIVGAAPHPATNRPCSERNA